MFTNSKIRLHILGLAHTITSNKYSHCAFTGKVLRFCEMMVGIGFEVYHYGIETSETMATKNIKVLSLEEWENLRKISVKFLNPNFTDEEIANALEDKTKFVGDLGNVSTPLYKVFNNKLKNHIIENYRSTSTDIVCLPFGQAHDEALKDLNVVCVESGIGYENSYRDYRIFESYAILHQTMALEKRKAKHYWFVIPNYYNLREWNFNPNPIPKRVGFFGRICDIKGCDIIVEIAKRLVDVEFILCGQGDPTKYLIQPNIKYKEPLEGLKRSEYLESLNVLLAPTYYVEPFCGVNVEAQLCGTPVISNDCGAFVETIENFKTGILAHTLEDFCQGVKMALEGYFDRNYIRDRATKLYDMNNIAYKYEYAFKNILEVHNGNNGWYSPNCYLKLLEPNKNNQLIKWYWFYTPDYNIWNINLYENLSKSDIFKPKPIKVNKIIGLNDLHPKHHFTGCYFKIELLCNVIKKNLGSRIVFTDATWYINPLKIDELEKQILECKYGITFCNNQGNGDLNIGIMIIDCNEKILHFFNGILNEIKNDNTKHDQILVNDKISNPNLLDYNKFIASRFIDLDKWNHIYKDNFIMLKIFVNSTDDKKTRDNYRMECMNKLGYFN
jgi:glycosyltransferase involved in cell wall biosynthesis